MLRRSQNDCITRLFGDKHVFRSRQPAGHLLRTSSFILLEYMSKGVDGKTWSCYAPSTTALSVQSEQAALLSRVITGHERLDHFCTRLISQKYDAQRERTVQSVCVGGESYERWWQTRWWAQQGRERAACTWESVCKLS